MASEARPAKQDFSENFYEQLKCHICKSRLKAGKHRWYKCLEQHLVCQDCKGKKISTCSCNSRIPDKYCKVIDAGFDSDIMQFKCENLIRGCQETMEEEDMIFHQTECIYRLVICPFQKCELEVPFHELLEHMETKKCFVSLVKKEVTFWKESKRISQPQKQSLA